MAKQKFKIGDKVYVKHGRKDEIGRVGNITQIRKYSGRLGYIVKYNDKKFPKSGVFYADMLLFSDMLAKDCIIKNENTKCKYCDVPFNEIVESKEEQGACEYCVDQRKHISDINLRKSAYVDLEQFSIYGHKGDWLEVTEWTNGEGFDVLIHYANDHDETDHTFKLSYDEFTAIVNIVNKFGRRPIIFTKPEKEN